MDEEDKIKTDNIDPKMRESVSKQLDSFINPSEKINETPVDEPDYVTSMIKEKSLLNQTEIPKNEPTIKIPDIPKTSEIELQKQIKPIIRTYKSDVEETIQTSHISSVNIAIAESKKTQEQIQKTKVEERKIFINKTIIIVSLVLVFGGIAAFFIPQLILHFQNNQNNTQPQIVDSKPIMIVDLAEKINIKDIDLNRLSTTLQERVSQSATQLGQIKNIYLTEGTSSQEKLLTASEFLTLIRASAPDQIQRTLEDPYMFGLHNYNGNQTFLILKVGEYDTAFSGMLQWETNLWQNFKELFNLGNNDATSTNSYQIEIKKFQDATFNNKDCRVVKDDSGNIIFLYSIIDNNTIVITTSTNTLSEIINRVSKARIVTQ